jgi:hypothetical protein
VSPTGFEGFPFVGTVEGSSTTTGRTESSGGLSSSEGGSTATQLIGA